MRENATSSHCSLLDMLSAYAQVIKTELGVILEFSNHCNVSCRGAVGFKHGELKHGGMDETLPFEG